MERKDRVLMGLVQIIFARLAQGYLWRLAQIQRMAKEAVNVELFEVPGRWFLSALLCP